ncbi:YjeF N-terminal domain-containing protein [Scheffersomyces coipomensis]|uniref:YjeF N-terminal domain-containing protein n=1 Tax=Scheffersomyces coipomensis TaxID=1788519 RepID=UPI00315C682A
MIRSTFKTLSAKAASQLDQELMSTGAFSIDQLMELAGLAVAQAVYKQYPPTSTSSSSSSQKVLVLVGPGNNGGDGLVAARHLKLWGGYDPILYYPKKSSKNQLYTNLLTQLVDLEVPEISTVDEVKHLLSVSNNVKLIIDALFGFSFKPPIREPFLELITYLSENHTTIVPIVSIDIPSGWDVDNGPGEIDINPTMLISLTAPKPCAAKFIESSSPDKSHYLGGRFINQKIAKKYDIEDLIQKYKDDQLIVKL